MADYIEKRRRCWYAVLDIPRDVRAKLGGKARWVQSLKTENRQQAQRTARPVIAHWKQRIHQARGGGDDLVTEALVWRDLIEKETDPEQQELMRDFVTDKADKLWQKGAPSGETEADVAKAESSTLHIAERFVGIALGTRTPIGEYFEAFLAEQDVREKTLEDHRRAMDALRKHHQLVNEIDRKAASAFVRERLLPNLKPATINRRLNTYRQYWDWLKDRGHIPEERANPWLRQSVKAKKGDELKRRAFTEEEAAALLNALGRNANKYPDDLPAAMLLAVTGMRAEEAASLVSHNVMLEGDTAWVTIEEGKTDAASRRIPVTEGQVVQELRRRIGFIGYLFPDLGGKARENSRGGAFKKRAARVLDKINDSPEVVANHSWRHRATDMLERGGNDRHICDYYVGHAQKGIGLNTYVSQLNVEKLVSAARCMYLPDGFG